MRYIEVSGSRIIELWDDKNGNVPTKNPNIHPITDQQFQAIITSPAGMRGFEYVAGDLRQNKDKIQGAQIQRARAESVSTKDSLIRKVLELEDRLADLEKALER